MVEDLAEAPGAGDGAAAIVSAAVGCLTLAVFALAGDASKPVAGVFTFWKPTGPLSGVSDAAIIVWLATWFVLSRLWRRRDVNVSRTNVVAGTMFAAAFLLTFPPFADVLLGK